jgi:hypothetical protein
MIFSSFHKILNWALLGFCGLFFGCGHYQLGLIHNPPFKTMFIEPIRNVSYAPQAQALLSDALARAFATDGTIRLTGKGMADADMRVTIVDYRQTMAASLDTDTVLAASYEVVLEAKVSIVDAQSGRFWIQDLPVSATTQIFTKSGYVQGPFEGMPVLTRDLANKICGKVISAW